VVKPLYRDRAIKLAQRALGAGGNQATDIDARPRPLVEVDWSRDCLRPVTREFWTREDRRQRKRRPASPEGFLRVICAVQCRRCDNCRRRKRRMWALRARREINAATRTWFGTLTLRPEEHHRLLGEARMAEAAQGIDFDALPEAERFRLLAGAEGKLLTDFLKRVRKETSASPRYLLVTEQHKTGLPHWHILLSEQSVSLPIRKTVLERQWIAGFSHWRLINAADPDDQSKRISYVTKYVAKSSLCRVRASKEYGEVDRLTVES